MPWTHHGEVVWWSCGVEVNSPSIELESSFDGLMKWHLNQTTNFTMFPMKILTVEHSVNNRFKLMWEKEYWGRGIPQKNVTGINKEYNVIREVLYHISFTSRNQINLSVKAKYNVCCSCVTVIRMYSTMHEVVLTCSCLVSHRLFSCFLRSGSGWDFTVIMWWSLVLHLWCWGGFRVQFIQENLSTLCKSYDITEIVWIRLSDTMNPEQPGH